MKTSLSSLLIISALTMGCSSAIETSGQVFIDSANGSSIKISQVDIYVVPQEVLIGNIKSSIPVLKEEYRRLHEIKEKRVESLTRDAAMAEKVAAQAAINRMALNMGMSSSISGSYLASETRSLVTKSSEMLEKSQKDYEEANSEFLGLTSGENSKFYIPVITKGISVATTSDADGKFKLTLENEKRVAIVAKKGDYNWLIWVTPKKDSQIFLTDKNINGTQCNECIFSSSQFNSTLSFIPETLATALAD